MPVLWLRWQTFRRSALHLLPRLLPGLDNTQHIQSWSYLVHSQPKDSLWRIVSVALPTAYLACPPPAHHLLIPPAIHSYAPPLVLFTARINFPPLARTSCHLLALAAFNLPCPPLAHSCSRLLASACHLLASAHHLLAPAAHFLCPPLTSARCSLALPAARFCPARHLPQLSRLWSRLLPTSLVLPAVQVFRFWPLRLHGGVGSVVISCI